MPRVDVTWHVLTLCCACAGVEAGVPARHRQRGGRQGQARKFHQLLWRHDFRGIWRHTDTCLGDATACVNVDVLKWLADCLSLQCTSSSMIGLKCAMQKHAINPTPLFPSWHVRLTCHASAMMCQYVSYDVSQPVMKCHVWRMCLLRGRTRSAPSCTTASTRATRRRSWRRSSTSAKTPSSR